MTEQAAPTVEEVEAMANEAAKTAENSKDVLGTLEAEEKELLQNLQARANQIHMELGRGVVKMAQMLGGLTSVEEHAQQVLSNIGKRLNVPEGQNFRFVGDDVHIVPNNNPES
jgi:hypothetical protein